MTEIEQNVHLRSKPWTKYRQKVYCIQAFGFRDTHSGKFQKSSGKLLLTLMFDAQLYAIKLPAAVGLSLSDLGLGLGFVCRYRPKFIGYTGICNPSFSIAGRLLCLFAGELNPFLLTFSALY